MNITSKTHVLENDLLKVTVADAGAELISVIDKKSGKERIWVADPSVWNRHAPILFPFIGNVVDKKYRIGGKEYSMKTQHGFARDMGFTCIEEDSEKITHFLKASDITKEI
jgi:galactose mutarotase-like enzyme